MIWSGRPPTRRPLLNVINGATKRLDVEEVEFSDTTMVNAIVAAENRGVNVRVVLEDPSSGTAQRSPRSNTRAAR